MLSVPVSQACKEGEIIKNLFYWHQWQSHVTPLSIGVLDELIDIRELVEEIR